MCIVYIHEETIRVVCCCCCLPILLSAIRLYLDITFDLLVRIFVFLVLSFLDSWPLDPSSVDPWPFDILAFPFLSFLFFGAFLPLPCCRPF